MPETRRQKSKWSELRQLFIDLGTGPQVKIIMAGLWINMKLLGTAAHQLENTSSRTITEVKLG